MQAKFFNKIIKERLLSHFGGYVASKSASFFKVPMNHLWRGFSFAGSSVPNWFYVYVNVRPLYMPPTDFDYIAIGTRLLAEPTHTWEWDDARAEEIIDRILQRMKTKEVELLQRLQSPEDIGRTGPQLFGTESWDYLEIFAFSLIYVRDYAGAKPMLEDLCGRLKDQRTTHKVEISEMEIRDERMLDFLNREPQKARNQLLQWEEETIKNLKLEEYPN